MHGQFFLVRGLSEIRHIFQTLDARFRGHDDEETAGFFCELLGQDNSSLLKKPLCRLLKKISEARRAKNRQAEAYIASTLERGD
jgi:hypothetical protein